MVSTVNTKVVVSPKLVSLHRYFIWADRMKVHFDSVLNDINSNRFDDMLIKKKEGIDTFMYMSLWYGLLYVLIEGWIELGLCDKNIDKLLESKNVALLKHYRNGVFHFQKKYYDKRFTNLMEEGMDVANWTRELRDEFSRWFLEVFIATH